MSSTPNREIIVRFEDVSFEYGHNKPILDEVSFSLRRGVKVTIMGQNGAGKSTLFSLITGTLKPESGGVHISQGLSIVVSRQVISPATPKLIQFFYGIEMMVITFVWFALLSLVFSNSIIRARIVGVQHYVERVTGVVLIALGIKVALASQK